MDDILVHNAHNILHVAFMYDKMDQISKNQLKWSQYFAKRGAPSLRQPPTTRKMRPSQMYARPSKMKTLYGVSPPQPPCNPEMRNEAFPDF